MKKHFAIIILMSLGWKSYACTCNNKATNIDIYNSSSVVFIGKVEKLLNKFSGDSMFGTKAFFSIQKSWKIPFNMDTITVTSGFSSCSYAFQKNQYYLIHARGDSVFSTNMCMFNSHLSSANSLPLIIEHAGKGINHPLIPFIDTILVKPSTDYCGNGHKSGKYTIFQFKNANDSSIYAVGTMREDYRFGDWTFYDSSNRVYNYKYYKIAFDIDAIKKELDKGQIIDCYFKTYDKNYNVVMSGEFKNGRLWTGKYYIYNLGSDRPNYYMYYKGEKTFYYKRIE